MKTFLFILGLTAAVSIIPCVLLIVRKHAALRAAEQCQGTVIAHVPRMGGGKSGTGMTYALKIEYKDRSGAAHEFTTSGATNPPSRECGEKVTVFHHADGRRPNVLIFGHLYAGYWIWFCFAGCVAGAMLAPYLLPRIYLR